MVVEFVNVAAAGSDFPQFSFILFCMFCCVCICANLVPSLAGSCPPEGLADVGLAAGHRGKEGGRLRGGQAGTVWGGWQGLLEVKFTTLLVQAGFFSSA